MEAMYRGVAAFATIENRREFKGKGCVPRTSRAKSTIKAFCDLLKCRADAAEERIGPPEGHPSLKIREKLPLTSPILHGRKLPPEVEKRGRIRRRWWYDVELPRDGRLNARYGLPYDNSIDKKLFPAATSYIILETETDNEIPPLTVGV
ncbi:hypothetical protein ALC56_14215 [Trachymyrmex septentrionalis]|uniref:Uncharacterized protein n=1 Tax=Trachymyrmex septentrionalis TaxID=34720 RepID=A0A195ETX7_9HYME|nr:hypothetical protein ALC56_14215 [Trachymyrmex septentrionalis]